MGRLSALLKHNGFPILFTRSLFDGDPFLWVKGRVMLSSFRPTGAHLSVLWDWWRFGFKPQMRAGDAKRAAWAAGGRVPTPNSPSSSELEPVSGV